MRSAYMLAAGLLTACASVPPEIALQSRFDYSDVTRFYRVYDAAGGHPDATVLQRDYLDPGSAGLKTFIPNRIVSAERLAKRIEEKPGVYVQSRTCLSLLPKLNTLFNANMRRFLQLYPEATIPNVTAVIGRDTSGGTATDAGVILGLEVVCRADSPSRFSAEDRLNHLIAHEVAHTSQTLEGGGTLLEVAIREGTADLITELLTGEISNDHPKVWTRGKEARIERDFRAQLDSTDLRDWVYNGVGTAERPGDLAYWVGYRIAKSYYDRASDKHAALRRLLTDPDAKAILRDSGWSEGS